MEFLEINELEFSNFAHKQADENFWQSKEMAHLRIKNGWQCKYVGVKQGDTLIAACMLSYRKVFMSHTYVQALRGFYIDYRNSDLMHFFHEHLVKFLETLQCMYFKIDPYVPLVERDIDGNRVEGGFDHHAIITLLQQLGYVYGGHNEGDYSSSEPNWMFVKNLLPQTEEESLQDFDSQTRWSIRKTMKIGINIKEAQIEDVGEFKKIMDHTAQRRSFTDRSMEYYENLFNTFAKTGKMKALFAQLDTQGYKQYLEKDKQTAFVELEMVDLKLTEQPNSKKFNKKRKVIEEQIDLIDKQLQEAEVLCQKEAMITLAAAVFMTIGKEVVYLFSGAYDEYKKFNGPYAIQWYMMRYAIENGYQSYNFYGISGNFQKDAEDHGVYEFKKGFGGTVIELLGDFHYIMKPNMYRIYKSLKAVKQKFQ